MFKSAFGLKKTQREPDRRSGHPPIQRFSSVSSHVPPTPKTPYIGSRPLPTSPSTAHPIVFPSSSPDSTLSGSSYDSEIRAPQPRYPLPFPSAPPTTAPLIMQPVTTRARTRDPIRRTSESQMPAAHTPHPTATSRGVPAQVPSTLPPRTRDRLTSSQRTPHSTDAPEPAQPVPKVPLSRPYSPPPRALPGRVPTPVFPFPRPPKGILKKQPLPFDVPLHRYIIPYNTELYGEDQKLLYWDVSMLPDNVRDYHASVALGRRELDTRFASKLGTNFTRMIIDCPRIKDCYIEVNNEKGITCRDIFKAIYLKFKAKLTEEEKMFYFRETGKLYETRLEMLNGVTVFMGIRPSAVYNTSWELILGRDPDEGKNKIFVGQTQ